MQKIIECVPNFSEGNNREIIQQITNEIISIKGVKLLDVDMGKATNRTVVTFAGEPEAVIDAAFLAIKKASELIDMRHHTGEHPRMGATDVCPLVPIANITMEETVAYAKKLAQKVGNNLNIPIYLYEYAASTPNRQNLATIRSGEYEGLENKLNNPNWKPDYGPSLYNPTIAKCGATVIGARDILIAYNVNLNTTSTRRANSVAFDVREQGRLLPNGTREDGMLKNVKGIGWFIKEYGIAQVSMNLTKIDITPIHIAFEACCESANKRGMRVSGSELVGLIPLKAILDAGKYFLQKQKRSIGVSEEELIKIAVKSMGLDELSPFDPKKKIIEYVLSDTENETLVNLSLKTFAEETASESPAPGGGSVSAYVGALGVSLGTMVANLSAHKKGWDDNWELFSNWANKGQIIKNNLIALVDEDTNAFNGIMKAFQLPKNTVEEKNYRGTAIEAATQKAIEVPFKVMNLCFESLTLIQAMAQIGNPNSVSDAGVGALCARSAILGAFLNVQINASSLKDKAFIENILEQGKQIVAKTQLLENEILNLVQQKINEA